MRATRFGERTLDALIEHLFDSTERMVRKEIEAIPDGVYHGESWAFYDGVTDGTRMKINLAVTVKGDEDRMVEALDNLIRNAVEILMESEGSRELEIGTKLRDDGMVEVSVADSGAGLAPEVRSHLFQPFVQADSSTTRRFGGTGLGLAISRRIAEMHGGRIWLNSEPGKGSKFTFTLPADGV